MPTDTFHALEWMQQVSLAPYTTYKVGGKARWFATIRSIEQLKEALKFCSEKKIPFYCLGKGSNTLFDDRGFNGAILLNQLNQSSFEGPHYEVGSGVSFPWLGIHSAKRGYSGLEFAAGVPASVGGAIYMNAGANGQETKQTLKEVLFIDQNGSEKLYRVQELQFAYRTSSFQKMKGVIAKAIFHLEPNKNARELQKKYLEKRGASQPLKDPSCGCVFRNFEDQSVGALIEKLGLKGKTIGGAQISPKHANFIINTGHAKASDILSLIEWVEEIILEKFGQKPYREVRQVPYEGSL